MAVIRHIVFLAPLFAVAWLLAQTTGDLGAVAAFGAPLWVATIRRGRLALSAPAQMLVLLGCGAAAFVYTTLVPVGHEGASEALRPAYAQLAFAALLVAGARLHVRDPVGGPAATYGIGLLVFLACGTVRVGILYPQLLLQYAVWGFFALRVADVDAGGRPESLPWAGRSVITTVVVAGGAAVLAVAFATAIPRFYSLAYAWALDWVDERHRSGFHDGPMRLGSLEDLLVSSRLVMRVEGDAGDHLVGQVYTHYVNGRWLPAAARDRRTLRLADADEEVSPGSGVRAVVRLVGRHADRFFVPPLAGGLRLAPSNVRVDAFGIVRTAGGEDAERLVLLDTGALAFPRTDPTPDDELVPDRVRAAAEALNAEWLAEGMSPAERIATIETHLESDFVYSLERDDAADGLQSTDAGGDPVLSFLLDDRRGHCEYFASAMTLLARSAGVPARLVTGYRIAEHNPLGDYAVVRERHAHAWTEVYLGPAGWVTVDPSPLRGTAPAEAEITPWLPALGDYAWVTIQRRGPEALLIALVAGLAAAQLWRIARSRPRRGRADGLAFAGPPSWLSRVLERLEEAGLDRRPSETLESLARRSRQVSRRGGQGARELAEAALLLRRYTALRYGGEGNAEALRADCERWFERDRPSDDPDARAA